jgi:hypothetical protein
VLVSALNDDGSVDTDTMRSMAKLTATGGKVVLTTVSGVKEALDRDGYGKPTDTPHQLKLFDGSAR